MWFCLLVSFLSVLIQCPKCVPLKHALFFQVANVIVEYMSSSASEKVSRPWEPDPNLTWLPSHLFIPDLPPSVMKYAMFSVQYPHTVVVICHTVTQLLHVLHWSLFFYCSKPCVNVSTVCVILCSFFFTLFCVDIRDCDSGCLNTHLFESPLITLGQNLVNKYGDFIQDQDVRQKEESNILFCQCCTPVNRTSRLLVGSSSNKMANTQMRL